VSKQLPPPAGGDDLTALLRSRHARTDDAPPTPPPAAPKRPRTVPEPPPRPARDKGPTMDRRSWYMPKESADALASALEEIHFTTRRPKHVILAALVAVALEQLDDVRERLDTD